MRDDIRSRGNGDQPGNCAVQTGKQVDPPQHRPGYTDGRYNPGCRGQVGIDQYVAHRHCIGCTAKSEL